MDNFSDPDDKYHLVPESCYNGDLPIVCARIGIMVMLIVCIICCLFGRILQFHCYRNKHYTQYFVMYTGLLIMALLFIHTIYFPHVQWDFTNLLLIAIQLLCIYLYFSFWAFRLLKKQSLFIYVVVPIFLLLTFAYVGLFVWAVITVTDDSNECTKPQWLIFSVSQFIIVQFLLFTVIYISWKLNNVRTIRINRWSQKAQLIFLVAVYELITILMIVYDIFLIADGGKHCNSAVSKNKGVLVFMEIFLKFIRFLVPQLAIVIIFAPAKPHQSNDPDDAVEHINDRYFYPPLHNPSNGVSNTDKDPLVYPIQPPSLKPSSPEEHYPSLPKYGTYSSTSGYNFYQFRSPNNTSVN